MVHPKRLRVGTQLKVKAFMKELHQELGPCRLILKIREDGEHDYKCTEPIGKRSKYSDEDIAEIIRLSNIKVRGKFLTHNQIAESVGCSSSYVGAIIRGERK